MFRNKKFFLISLITVFLLLFVSSYFFLIKPVLGMKSKIGSIKTSAAQLKQAFMQNDIDQVASRLNDFSKKYSDFEKEAQSIYWISAMPFAGNYSRDLQNGVEAGRYLVEAGKLIVEAITPYADLIGFKKGTSSFADKSADERMQTAVLTLDKVLGKIDQISDKINQVQLRINKINPERYPESIGKTVVRAQLINLKDQVNGMSTLFVDAKPLLKNIPEIFGKDEQKIYLVLFQNDKELRATGGFLTSYALFKIEEGRMRVERSEDIYSLDETIKRHPEAPQAILTYHKDVNKFFIRDSNLSPDLPESIKLFNSLYDKSTRKVEYDGIILVDSKVLVDMLKIFGDTETDGITFSAKIDKRCDCPQVLYTLFDLIDRPVNYIKTNRKGILGDLMYALFYKAISFSPSKYWGTLTQSMLANLQSKHILLYFKNPEIQQSVEKLNYAGRVRQFDGDYLYVNDVNFAGAKSNMFVSHTINSKTKISSSGKITRELVIQYKNPYKHSDCSLERGGLCLNATLRDWLRVYVPKGAKLLDFKGSQKKVNVYDELNKTVFEGFLLVNPQGKAEVRISYQLPENISGQDYQLLIQKQPGTGDHKLIVDINDSGVFDGILDEDKVIKIR